MADYARERDYEYSQREIEAARKRFASRKLRARLYARLEHFVSVDRSEDDALYTIHMQVSDDRKTPNRPIAVVANEWRRLMRTGADLDLVLDGWVPVEEAMALVAAKRAGRFAAGLRAVMRNLTESVSLTGMVVRNLFPGVSTALNAFILMTFYAYALWPKIAEHYDPRRWSGIGVTAAWGYWFFHDFLFVPTAILVAAVSWMIVRSLATYCGKYRPFLDNFPPWSFYRFRWTNWVLETVYQYQISNTDFHEALMRMRRFASPYLLQRLDELIRYSKANGLSLSFYYCHLATGWPDRDLVDDMRSAESRGGQFDQALAEVIEKWRPEPLRRLTLQLWVLGFICFLVAAFFYAVVNFGSESVTAQATDNLRNEAMTQFQGSSSSASLEGGE